MPPRNTPCTLFILLLFVLLGGCSSSTDHQIAPIPLFPGQHGKDLAQITVSDAATDLDFKRLDSVWGVGNDNKSSDEARISVLAEKLATMVPYGPVAIGPERYNDFKVGDESFSRKVVLIFMDNSSYTLLIGTPAITRPVYLRFKGSNMVYKIDEPLFRQISLIADSWRTHGEG